MQIENSNFSDGQLGIPMSNALDTGGLAERVAILVSSCDKYQDLWPIFFTLFWRYWPDCPFSVYLLANHARYDDPRVKSVCVGDDHQWASNCRLALREIQHPYIFLMEEENLYRKSVNTTQICDLINFMVSSGAGCLRLYPSPGPDRAIPGRKDIGVIERGAAYRVGFAAGVWRRDILENLLVDGETGWDMELKGSRRSDLIAAEFLSVTLDPATGPPLPYMSRVIVRGKWSPEAVELCRKEGIHVDGTLRPIRTKWQEWWEASLIRATLASAWRFLRAR